MRNILMFLFLVPTMLLTVPTVSADWWQRPCDSDRENGSVPIVIVTGADPHFDGNCPTETEEPEPEPTVEPTSAPAEPSLTVVPTINPGGTSDDDPCAPGKSYVGDYCGWSPRIGGDSDSNSSGGTGDVLGLSNTSGETSMWSDILMLAGIASILMYVRSKFPEATAAN